jgi:hypothetical protein
VNCQALYAYVHEQKSTVCLNPCRSSKLVNTGTTFSQAMKHNHGEQLEHSTSHEKFKQMLPKLESLNQQLALHHLPLAAVVAWHADHVCAVLLASEGGELVFGRYYLPGFQSFE